MAIIAQDNAKVFEKPNSGEYVGVIADVVDLGIVPTQYGNKARVRIVWVLGKPDGSGYAVDSEGKPYQVINELTASMNEKADLFKLVRAVLDTNPPAGPYDVEQLIGKSKMLFVVREKSKDGAKDYANIKAVLPLKPGVGALQIPTGFKRYTKNTSSNSFSAQAPAQQAPAPALAPAPATIAQLSTPAAQQPTAASPAEVVLDKQF